MQPTRLILVSGIVATALIGRSEPVPALPTFRPNLVVILADDLGYSDLGCYGGEIPTPRLDALASQGEQYTRFYATPRCSPTRASLLTGLYPQAADVGVLDIDLGRPGYHGTLAAEVPTVAERLRAAGYRTAMTGKWHVGRPESAWPRARGFERFYGSPLGGGLYFGPVENRPVYLDDARAPVDDPDWYSTEAFTTQAIAFAKEAVASKKPFFLYVASIAPHYPLMAPEAEIAKFSGRYDAGWQETARWRWERQRELGLFGPTVEPAPLEDGIPAWDTLGTDKRADLARRMEVYAAQVAILDREVGRLLDALDELGVADNTLVLFLSDNGACDEGGVNGINRGAPGSHIGNRDSYASYGRGWAAVSNTPWAGYKSQVDQGGIAVPAIVRWPRGAGPTGTRNPAPAHVIDLLPTLLDLAGVEAEAVPPGFAPPRLPGRNLRTRGASAPADFLAWEHMGNRALLAAGWKIVARFQEPWRLYAIDDDPTEQHDLAEAEPERVAAMVAQYERWAAANGVLPWPLPRSPNGGE